MTGDGKLPTVGILGGTGPQGRGLGLRLALADYEVVLGSRSPERAADAARGLVDDHDVADGLLTGGPNHEAAARDIVIVTVPFDGVRPLLEPLGDLLAGTLVISCVNRMGFDRDGPHPIPVPEGSAAELVAELAPAADVYGAFHHVPAGRLTRDLGPLDMDVLITGDGIHPDVRDLVESIEGVRAVPAGPLRLSRPLEELTAVIIAVNRHYNVASGIRLTGLPDSR
ncbi:MAG TPA: NADPH-dependent F420 reductase [Euzebyales bacterium]|nr:NADPH-dependent F420 reductase [Euzebyales bacterium]